MYSDAIVTVKGKEWVSYAAKVSLFTSSPPELNRVASGALTGKGKTAAVQAEEGRKSV